MSSPNADHVRETSTSEGTGDFTLDGAASALYDTFEDAFGVGPSFHYTIEDPLGLEREVGVGHLSGATTLVRDTVISGSNGTSKVDFGPGRKDVLCSPVGSRTPSLNASGLLSADQGGTGVNGSAAANGQLLIGNGSGLTLATLTGMASQIVVTNGAGSITLGTSPNLNADTVDGQHASAFAAAAHSHAASDITSGTLAKARGGLAVDASSVRPSLVGLDVTGVSRRAYSSVGTAYSLEQVAGYADPNNVTGTLKITLPAAAFGKVVIEGLVSHSVIEIGQPFRLEICGNYVSGAWYAYGVRATGQVPFATVRLAHDGSNPLILLGSLTTTWYAPTIVVHSTIGQASTWDANTWAVARITSETGITVGAELPVAPPVDGLTLERACPNTVGDHVELGYFTYSGLATALEVQALMQVHSNASAAKLYQFGVNRNTHLDGAWYRLLPLCDTDKSSYLGAETDFALELKHSSSGNRIDLRMVRTVKTGSPTSSPTVLFRLRYLGKGGFTFTESTATGTGSVSSLWENTVVCQKNAGLGVNNEDPLDLVHVKGNGGIRVSEPGAASAYGYLDFYNSAGSLVMRGGNLSSSAKYGWANSGNTAGFWMDLASSTFQPVMQGNKGDGASAVNAIINASTTFSTAGAKLLSVRNSGTEKLFVDKDGVLQIASRSGTPSGVSGFAGIYTNTVSSVAELFALGSDGVGSQQSSHPSDAPTSLYDDDVPVRPTIRKSIDYRSGYIEWINVTRQARLVERLAAGELLAALPASQRQVVMYESFDDYNKRLGLAGDEALKVETHQEAQAREAACRQAEIDDWEARKAAYDAALPHLAAEHEAREQRRRRDAEARDEDPGPVAPFQPPPFVDLRPEPFVARPEPERVKKARDAASRRRSPNGPAHVRP